jgi:hypothetical protein
MNTKGKMTLSVVIVLIILVGFFSLYPVFALEDNYKEYDSVNKIVTIKDSSGEVISDITLNTPLNYMVPRGYQKVAEFTIDNKVDSQKTSSMLERLEFYDVNNGMEKFDRPFDYKYERSLGLKDVNDYETVCVDKENQNGTIVQECSQNLIGTHQEERFEWVDLDTLEEIPSGKIKIGIFTNVEKGDVVEWVPTFLGVEINEWATWTEDLNVGLVNYYPMDASSGTVVEDVVGSHNFTIINGDGDEWVSGLLGNALYTETDDYAINSDWFGNASSTDISLSLWVNATTLATDYQGIISKRQPAVKGYTLATETDDVKGYTLATETDDDQLNWKWGFDHAFFMPASDTNYHHYVVTKDGTNLTFYYDATYVNWSLVATATTDTKDTVLGRFYTATDNFYYDGQIDELGHWNRSLSKAEIVQLYNSSTGITWTDVFPNYTITFNLTDSISGEQISTSSPQVHFDISCDNGYVFNDIENPNTTSNTFSGTVECSFSDLSGYFDETLNITADSNKTVDVPMSKTEGLSVEEHLWLEAI